MSAEPQRCQLGTQIGIHKSLPMCRGNGRLEESRISCRRVKAIRPSKTHHSAQIRLHYGAKPDANSRLSPYAATLSSSPNIHAVFPRCSQRSLVLLATSTVTYPGLPDRPSDAWRSVENRPSLAPAPPPTERARRAVARGLGAHPGANRPRRPNPAGPRARRLGSARKAGFSNTSSNLRRRVPSTYIREESSWST